MTIALQKIGFSNETLTTHLNGAIDNVQTTITVDTASGMPGGTFAIRIDDELLFVTDTDATGLIWTVTRGWNSFGGTLALGGPAAHSNGAIVYNVVESATLQCAIDIAASQGRVTLSNTVVGGPADTTGKPSFLVAGTGLQLNTQNLDISGRYTTGTPIIVAGPGLGLDTGVMSVGDLGLFLPPRTAARRANETAVFTPALQPQITNYIFILPFTEDEVGYYHTPAPVQYGYTYDRTRQAILRFEGTDASTSILDDMGNTWTAAGNAQLDTAQFKYGGSSCLFDGTGDSIKSTNFTSLGNGSWTLEGFVRYNVLPTNGLFSVLVAASNAGGFGATLYLFNNAGTYQLRCALSSNGTSADIQASTSGTNITTPVVNTWYHWAITYDALAGKYFDYWNGTVAQSITSAAKIGLISQIVLGADFNGTSNTLNGWQDEFVFSPYCRYPNGTTYTPPAGYWGSNGANTDNDWVGDWYDMNRRVWRRYNAASTAAGTDPTLELNSWIYGGECDTNATVVTAVRAYAYNGRFESAWVNTLPGVSTSTQISHNLGVQPASARLILKCLTADAGYVPGDELHGVNTVNATYGVPVPLRLTPLVVSFSTMGTAAFSAPLKGGGANTALTAANWAYKVIVERGW